MIVFQCDSFGKSGFLDLGRKSDPSKSPSFWLPLRGSAILKSCSESVSEHFLKKVPVITNSFSSTTEEQINCKDIINKVIGYIPETYLSGREVKEAVCEIKYDSNTGHIFLSHINMGIFEGMEGYFKHLFSETLKEFKYRTVDHMDKPDRLFSVQENAESKEERQNKLNIYNEVLTQYGYSHTMEPPGIKVTPDRVAKDLKPQVAIVNINDEVVKLENGNEARYFMSIDVILSFEDGDCRRIVLLD